MTGAVWVYTQRFDSTADVVIEELNRRRVEVVRFDLNDITVSGELGGDGHRWAGSLSTPSRTAEFAQVAGIYYRRPTRPSAPPEADPQIGAWIAAETQWGLRGLLVAQPRDLWVNWPPAVHAAEHKPYQLVVAAECGLPVPRTLITNDPGAARRFAADAGPVLYKPFRGQPVHLDGQIHLTYATPVSAEQCDTDAVRVAPVMLQQIIDKACDVRVTVIDERMFGITPRGRDGKIPLDWRVDHGAMEWRPIEIPELVRSNLHVLCDRMGLRFAACDFSVDRSGRWWYLEANPVGQWAWNHPLLEPTTAAIADALTGKAHRD